MLRRLPRGALLTLALAASACLGSTAPAEPPIPTDPATVTYAPQLGVDLAAMTRDTMGLYYQDLVVGTGRTVGPSDSVVVSFAGYLPSGEQFTSSAPGVPLVQRLPGRLIFGFRQGLVGMAVGGKRKLVIPPLLGYAYRELRDDNGRTILPSNSVLVYDVELLARYE